MNDCNLRRFHALDLISDHEILTTTFWTNNNEGISFVEPWLNHSDISLNSSRLDDWWEILVFEIFNLDLSSLRCKDHPRTRLWIIVIQEWISLIRNLLSTQIHDVGSQLISDVQFENTSETLDDAEYKMTLGTHVIQVAECIVDDTDFCGFYNEMFLAFQSPIERGVEDVLKPGTKMISELFILLLEPGLGDSTNINVLLGEEDHTESTDRSR